jgi:hypothetical protein
VVIAALVGCGGDGGPYAVFIGVTGSATALATYSVMAGPKVAARENGQDVAILCTHDRQKFLNAEIPLVVEQNGAPVYTATLERYACRLSDQPGAAEQTFLYLQDDGTLLHDVTAGDPRVWQACLSAKSCTGDDL